MFDSADLIVNRLTRLRLTAARHFSRAMAATLMPTQCCLCGFPGVNPDLDLCAVCFDDLPWERTSHDAWAPLRYETPVDELIRRLKYRGELSNARVLGVLLAQSIRASGSLLPQLLVPVPLHLSRLRERGFNQAFGIARYAGRLLGVPYARNAVTRLRDTPSQTTLDPAARRMNVRGAFAVRNERSRKKLLAASHVAIVDDVVTTGSTVEEMRATLLAAGVQRVDVWAVARVVAPG